MTKDLKSLAIIEKKWGSQISTNLGASLFSVLPTGSLALDALLGVGGYPRGRIIEIYGAESSGKTVLCTMAAIQAQHMGWPVALLDLEHSFDPNWAMIQGLNPTKEAGFHQIVSPDGPMHAEMALEIIRELVKDFPLVIVDSVAALVAKAELMGEVGDRQVALVARLMSQTMRMITSDVKENGTIVLFTNQIRDQIGTGGYGPSYDTTGGRALKFYSSIRIEIFKSTSLGDTAEPIGNTIRVTIKKNKVAAPNRKGELTIYYDEGISLSHELIEWGLLNGHIQKKGTWLTLFPDTENEFKSQGKEKLRTHLRSNGVVLENHYRLSLGLPLKKLA